MLDSGTSTGNVEAPTDLSLSFQQSGQVTAIPVEVGTHVGAGQVLAKVDDTRRKIALQAAQAGLVSAQASYARSIRGGTAIDRESDAQSVVSAQQSITQAQQGVTERAAERGRVPREVPAGDHAGAAECDVGAV